VECTAEIFGRGHSHDDGYRLLLVSDECAGPSAARMHAILTRRLPVTRRRTLFVNIRADTATVLARLFLARLGEAFAQILCVHDWYNIDCCVQI